MYFVILFIIIDANYAQLQWIRNAKPKTISNSPSEPITDVDFYAFYDMTVFNTPLVQNDQSDNVKWQRLPDGLDDRIAAIIPPIYYSGLVQFSTPTPTPTPSTSSPYPSPKETSPSATPLEAISTPTPSNTPEETIATPPAPTETPLESIFISMPFETSSNNDNLTASISIFTDIQEYDSQTDSIFLQYQNGTQSFRSSVLQESASGGILPNQVTPSKDDFQACLAFWNVWPEGYNGSQITHCYPLSAVGRLEIYFDGIPDPFPCTGSLIGPRTVLTAAHCFTIMKEILQKDFTSIVFTPGQFGDYKPFGSFQHENVIMQNQNFNESQDYALVRFSEDIGKLTGWLGVMFDGCGNKTYDVMVAGYSKDRQEDEMWTSECDNTDIDPCLNGNSSGTFLHECDTNPGTSGAPLLDNNIIVGVHSGASRNSAANIATYISRQLMDFISTYVE